MRKRGNIVPVVAAVVAMSCLHGCDTGPRVLVAETGASGLITFAADDDPSQSHSQTSKFGEDARHFSRRSDIVVSSTRVRQGESITGLARARASLDVFRGSKSLRLIGSGDIRSSNTAASADQATAKGRVESEVALRLRRRCRFIASTELQGRGVAALTFRILKDGRVDHEAATHASASVDGDTQVEILTGELAPGQHTVLFGAEAQSDGRLSDGIMTSSFRFEIHW